jgi:hypothetical protein
MKPIIKRLILAGLMALPAACATYSRQYYDSGYGYSPGQYDSGYAYSPGQYNSGYGYGVLERNYYNTYSYPTPVYRTEEYRHHHHHDGHDNRYPGRRYQDGRRYSTSPGATYRKPGSHEHGANDHYNWNAPTAKPYDNRKSEWDRQRHDNRNEGRQRRPDDPNAHGQWRRQQNWERQEAKRQNRGVEERSFDRAESRRQNIGFPAQQNKQDGQQSPRGRRHRDRMEAHSGQ